MNEKLNFMAGKLNWVMKIVGEMKFRKLSYTRDRCRGNPLSKLTEQSGRDPISTSLSLSLSILYILYIKQSVIRSKYLINQKKIMIAVSCHYPSISDEATINNNSCDLYRRQPYLRASASNKKSKNCLLSWEMCSVFFF